MDIFQNLLPIIKTADGKAKTSKNDKQKAELKNDLLDKHD